MEGLSAPDRPTWAHNPLLHDAACAACAASRLRATVPAFPFTRAAKSHTVQNEACATTTPSHPEHLPTLQPGLTSSSPPPLPVPIT